MDKIKFGEFIRCLRIERKLTLRVAAEKIDIASPYLSRIESGLERPPSIACLERMAGAYGIDVQVLIEKASNRAKEVYGEMLVNNPALNVFFKVVRDLPEEKIIEAIQQVCSENGLDPQVFLQEIQKRKMNLPRLRRISEGLFAADIIPRRLSKIRIEDMAYKFLARHRFTPDTYCPPTPIEILVEREEGLRLYMDDTLKMFKNGEPMELGMSHWSAHQDGVREIHINYALEKGDYASDCRLRFTLGHELFHCIEHLLLMGEKERTINALRRALLVEKDVGSTSRKSTIIDRWLAKPNQAKRLITNEDWREWQADYFSACILMPDWSVRAEFFKRFGGADIAVEEGNDVRKVAYEIAKETVCTTGVYEKSLNKIFEVSAMAMAIRLLTLKLVHS